MRNTSIRGIFPSHHSRTLIDVAASERSQAYMHYVCVVSLLPCKNISNALTIFNVLLQKFWPLMHVGSGRDPNAAAGELIRVFANAKCTTPASCDIAAERCCVPCMQTRRQKITSATRVPKISRIDLYFDEKVNAQGGGITCLFVK